MESLLIVRFVFEGYVLKHALPIGPFVHLMIRFPISFQKAAPSSTSFISRKFSLFTPTSARMQCTKCRAICPKLTCQREDKNKGREFYNCSRVSTGCSFFKWADGVGTPAIGRHTPAHGRRNYTPSCDKSQSEELKSTLVVYTDGACLGTFCSSLPTIESFLLPRAETCVRCLMNFHRE